MAITASSLPIILAELEAMRFDERVKQDAIAQVDAWATLGAVSTMDTSLVEGDKKRTLKLWWPNMCGIQAEDCSSVCDVSGTPIDTSAVEYKVDKCKSVTPVEVGYLAYDTNALNAERILAFGLARQMKVLDEFLVQELIKFVDSKSGQSSWNNSPYWTNAGNSIGTYRCEVPKSNFSDLRLAHSVRYAATQNRFESPTMLTGWLLSEAIYKAQVNANNPPSADGVLRLASMPNVVVDEFNVEAANFVVGTPSVQNYKMYLLSRGAIAFGNRTQHPAIPYNHDGNNIIFRQESMNLPGVFYDVTFKKDCASGDLRTAFKMNVNYDFFLNPSGCATNNTGILEFLQVADPAPAVLGAAKASKKADVPTEGLGE